MVLLQLEIVLCATGFAVQYGDMHLSANRAVVLFLFESVIAAISSYFLADEAMQLRDWPGVLLIISACLLSGKLNTASKAD